MPPFRRYVSEGTLGNRIGSLMDAVADDEGQEMQCPLYICRILDACSHSHRPKFFKRLKRVAGTITYPEGVIGGQKEEKQKAT